jgi:hypothetical protein
MTRSGSRCRTKLNLSPDGLCLQHDPDRQEQAAEMRRAGGRATKGRGAKHPDAANVPAIPRTLDDAARYAAWLTDATIRGTIDARTSHEASVALREFRQATEKAALEQQLKELQRQVKELKVARSQGRTP